MDKDITIEVSHISKSFRLYMDRGNTLKEISLFSSRRRYEERKVLDDVSFNVKRGEAVGLIGHNGCGKSTTLKLLTKIMYPDSGYIKMKGRVSSLIELGAGFHPDMSGRENIYINASIFGLTKKEIDARVKDIIEFSELEAFIDNPVRTYSSGMYMRLAFAVAINVDADILLIDEILAVGDASFQAKCFDKLKSIKAKGVTIVIVTHDMNSAKTFCDRVIWINEGRIAGEGESMQVVDTYLAYMSGTNKTLSEKALGTDSGESEGEPKKESEVVLKEENREESEEEPKEEPKELQPNPLRYGNKNVVIESVKLLNSRGEETEVLQYDEKYYLKYKYKVNRKVDEIIVGMGIFTIGGVWVYGTNTLIANQKIECGESGGEITFESEPLKLLAGEYVLHCAIEGMGGVPMDYWKDCMHFKVVNPIREAGILHYDVKWKVDV